MTRSSPAPVRLAAHEWLTPLGGEVAVERGTLTLTGKGTDLSFGVAGAIAVLDRPLPPDHTIEGEIQVACEWAGFVLGYDGEAHTFVSLHAGSTLGEGHGLASALFTHRGATRAPLGNVPVGWARETWLPFRLTKTGRQVRFRLGQEPEETFTLPGNRTRGRFGVAEYDNGTVRLRNLRIGG